MLRFKPTSEKDKIRYGILSLIYAPCVVSMGYIYDKPHWLIIGLISWLLVARLDLRHIKTFILAGGKSRLFAVTMLVLMAATALAPFIHRAHEGPAMALLTLAVFYGFYVAWAWAPRVFERHGLLPGE